MVSQGISIELEGLRRFVEIYFEFANLRVTHESHPLTVLARLEAASPSKARQGLVMAVRDLVEASIDWPAEKVAEFDRHLAAHGATTLSKARVDYSKKFSKILERGMIRNEQEYFLVKGVRDGGVFSSDSDNAKLLMLMMMRYESKIN